MQVSSNENKTWEDIYGFYFFYLFISREMQVACSAYQRKRQKVSEREREREGEREGGIKGKRDACMEAGRRCV